MRSGRTPVKNGSRPRAQRSTRGKRRWSRYLLALAAVLGTVVGATFGYLYASFAQRIDERLHGERERAVPLVFARPVELRRGQALAQQDLVSRLNDLGYAQRADPDQPGEFALLPNGVAIAPRGGALAGRVVHVAFSPAAAVRQASARSPDDRRGIQTIEVVGAGRTDRVRLDAPLLTALTSSGAREKRRHVPLATMPKRMQQAVLAIEDQSFYSHPGINPVRLFAAAVTNVAGTRGGPVGSSTITQQLARMFFLMDEFHAELAAGERSYWRKAREGLMSLVLEQRASKDEILELYLNDIYLGQRGSFAIHGVAEASRLFFGKDVSNISLAEAALIAGVIQSPATRSPFAHPERAVERRNVVLRAMRQAGFINDEEAATAAREPLQVVTRAVDNEAPYFVDTVSQQVAQAFPGVLTQGGTVNIFTTLDLNLQRAALDAVRTGLARIDDTPAARRRRPAEPAQAALIAVVPQTGEIVAMVGGRSYNQSQYNRAVAARRQPGSVFKPFVFLAAFEHAAEEGRTDLTPASLTLDEPTTFTFGEQIWEPRNYDEYDGEITWRRALAMSRNLGTIHVGELIGFDRIATFWRRTGIGKPPQSYPSITLGAFEMTPLEVAQAYTMFLNGGAIQPLRVIERIQTGARDLKLPETRRTEAARADTTFLVTNMMRSVLNEGTGAGARRGGFTLDAAGKTGTTNDLRDAWFVGFTPELLTVVWVGLDSNRPLSLTGAQAALPIWTDFMKTALAGQPDVHFQPPAGISFVDIEPDTGKLALPGCSGTMTEAFLIGTEPIEYCQPYRWWWVR